MLNLRPLNFKDCMAEYLSIFINMYPWIIAYINLDLLLLFKEFGMTEVCIIQQDCKKMNRLLFYSMYRTCQLAFEPDGIKSSDRSLIFMSKVALHWTDERLNPNMSQVELGCGIAYKLFRQTFTRPGWDLTSITHTHPTKGAESKRPVLCATRKTVPKLMKNGWIWWNL